MGLYAVAGGLTVGAADAVSFILAAALLVLLRVEEEPPPRAEKRFRREVTAGFRFVASSPALRWAFIGTG